VSGPLPSTLAARARVIAALTAALPGLGPPAAGAALEAARAHAGRALRELDAFLAAGPEAVTGQAGDFPLAWARLARVLGDAGHAVTLPGCASCGAVTSGLLPSPAGRVCARCAPRREPKACARCRLATIMARRPEGGICNRCYRADPAVAAECTQCGRLRVPAGRGPDGRPVCDRCWGRPVAACSSCGVTARVKARGSDGPLCAACYRDQRQPARACARCGQAGPIASRAAGQDICYRCYRRPSAETACQVCGRVRTCQRTRAGTLACRSCQPVPRAACARCGRARVVAANWPLGPVCHSCYTTIRTRPARCGRCHAIRPLIAASVIGDQQAGICGPCAGLPAGNACSGCDSGAAPYAGGRCARCVLRDRLADLLSGPDGQVSPQLAPLAGALGSAANPGKALEWLSRSPAARLLARLAAGNLPVSHDLLDELPPGHGERYLRHALVAAGVLPERNDDLERIPAWLDSVLAGQPARHAALIRPFTTWDQLRRARRRTAGQTRTPATAARIRGRVRLALRFLDWLDANGTDLADLRQADVESWLSEGKNRYGIRYFLHWAARRGLTAEHDIPRPPAARSDPIMDEPERWQHINCCLGDDTLPLEVRLAGTLILLFGIPASRIRQLTPGHVSHHGDRTYLHIGDAPLLLPPRVADLLNRVVRSPRPRSRLNRDSQQRWLFPGLVPGQPITPKAFSSNLTRHGIQTRPGHGAALIALAGELPVPVLADLLGVHIHTAQKWAAHVQRDWATYLAAREGGDE
jgi:hypothetical protein